MATLNELKKYLSHSFSSGCETGEDYINFQTKYINYIRSLCKKNNLEVTKICRSHYEFSLFIKNNEDKFIYISICDVRFFKIEWYNNILYRQAQNEKDFTGGRNNYTSLTEFQTNITKLFIQYYLYL